MRRKIIEAAKELLKDRSFNDIRIDEIAKKAGITRQTVYRHVGSKSDLKNILLEEGLEIDPHPANTQEKILRAATEVFARTGYSDSTLEQVAKEIDMTKGAIYWYFSSKHDLFITLIEKRMNEQLSFVPEQLKKALVETDPVKGLTKFFNNQFSFVESDQTFSRLFMEFAAHSRDRDVRMRLSEAFQFLNEQLIEVVREMKEQNMLAQDLEPETIVIFSQSLIDGLIMSSLLYPEHVHLKKWAPQFARMLWQAIGPETSICLRKQDESLME
ncbi:MAG: helix-turn-helix transcriptional regulator [Bacillaceae bacterium]|nr:helix-turn-helix transcriptional regulator [Bacillaceae bacterium]